MTYGPGQKVQYFIIGHGWASGKYVGKRSNGRHVVETLHGGVVCLSDSHIRDVKCDCVITGKVVVYRREDGTLNMIGPYNTDDGVVTSIDAWKTIFPEGPLAVIDLTPMTISFSPGDGVPAKPGKAGREGGSRP